MGKKEGKGKVLSIDWDTSQREARKPPSLNPANGGTIESAPALGSIRRTSNTADFHPLHQQSRWKPDIYAHAFVPDYMTGVNRSPATLILTPGIDEIDFEKYIATFAGRSFLSPLPTPDFLKVAEQMSGMSLDHLTPDTYGTHFTQCLALDLEPRVPEMRSYDLFGVTLEIRDYPQNIYSLKVPGIKEGTPSVSFGDTLMLRQLIIDPQTRLPRGMNVWLAPGGGFDRGLQAPGFTGFQINAVVLGVDKANETLFLRAFGLQMINNLICNVTFVVQTPLIESFQRSIEDIQHELARNITATVNGTTTHTSNKWLQRVLFPKEEYGVLQKGLPSVIFAQQWFDDELNYEQKKAVDAVQSRNFGDLCYLISGPPGTGKTKTICEIATQLGRDTEFCGSLLLCAPSNPAADTLALRLKALFHPKELFRLNQVARTFAEVPQELLPYCHVENDVFNLPPFRDLMAYKVVIATCEATQILVQARVTNRDLWSLQDQMVKAIDRSTEIAVNNLHWTALLIDEAAQATEPESLIPLTVVAPPIDLPNDQSPIFAMAGDEYQLGPRTYDRSTSLHVSLFERLSKTPAYAAHPLARRNMKISSQHGAMLRPPFVNLIRNYRSHPAILAVPSSLFYANTLIPEATNTESLRHWSHWRGRHWPILFACNAGLEDCEDIRGVGGGWYNLQEANKALDFAQSLLSDSSVTNQSEICIMSPFPAQVNRLRRLARQFGLWNVNIGPTEAFQGLEHRFVILCTTRARNRFLDEDQIRGMGIVNESKKFNVAITRAKEGLVVIGNPWTLAVDPCWLAFMHFCWRNALWQSDDNNVSVPQDQEFDVNAWSPSMNPDDKQNLLALNEAGLEAALIYRDRDHETGSQATRRFMRETKP